MLVWVYLLLVCVSAWGLQEEKTSASATKQPDLPKLKEVQHQENDNRARKTVRECQGKCMAGIAQKAAAEAKAAQQAQNEAGKKASHMVKIQLAQKALQAAKAAEAALAGKQAAVQQLQEEVKHAQCVVKHDVEVIQQIQSTVSVAEQAAAQANALHKLMCQARQLAATLDKTAQCVLGKARAGLQLNCNDLALAKARLARLQHKLQCACADCKLTKEAAFSACESARAACGNSRKKKEIKNDNSEAVVESEETTVVGR